MTILFYAECLIDQVSSSIFKYFHDFFPGTVVKQKGLMVNAASDSQAKNTDPGPSEKV